MQKSINSAVFRKMVLAGAKMLENNRAKVDALNVFPVPDGDTGTNMSMTIMSAAKEVSALQEPDMASLCKAISSGSLRGARGNSGVILSQLLRGFTKAIKKQDAIDVPLMADAFQKAVDDGVADAATFGTDKVDWYWQRGGKIALKKGKHTLALHDLTGFDGRCDAIVLTTTDEMPGDSLEEYRALRAALLGAETPVDKGEFDFVVAGGGVAGMCAAIAGYMVSGYYQLVYFTMGTTAGLKAFAAAVLGGIGILSGSVVGGILIGLCEALATVVFGGEYSEATAYVILFLVLLIKPSGLFGKDDVDEKV